MASKFEFQVQILPLQVEPETASFCHTTNEYFVMFLRPERLKRFKMQIEGKTKASCFMLISPSLVLSPNHNAVMCGSGIWSLNHFGCFTPLLWPSLFFKSVESQLFLWMCMHVMCLLPSFRGVIPTAASWRS